MSENEFLKKWNDTKEFIEGLHRHPELREKVLEILEAPEWPPADQQTQN